MSELDVLREQIDEIDRKIVALYEKRAAVSKRVGAYKKQAGLTVLDEQREKSVIASRVRLLVDETLAPDIEELFCLMMRLSREKQA